MDGILRMLEVSMEEIIPTTKERFNNLKKYFKNFINNILIYQISILKLYIESFASNELLEETQSLLILKAKMKRLNLYYRN